ncbi:MAG: M36 family metallopeptidase [Niastella sp.]|nr:M36 family metallopeptidase [Niastella sp.]
MLTTSWKRNYLCLFITLLLLNAVAAQQRRIDVKQTAVTLLRKNLRTTGLNQSSLDDYHVSDAHVDKKTGDLIVYLQQGYLGVPVFNKIGVFVFRNDTLVEKRLDYVEKIQLKAGMNTAPAVTAMQAVQRAGKQLAIPVPEKLQMLEQDVTARRFVFDGKGIARQNLRSDLMWLPVNDGRELKLSWRVRIGSADGQQEWVAHVDAQSGEFLQKHSLIVSERGYTDGDHAMVPVDALQKNRMMSVPVPFAPPPPTATSVNYRVYAHPLESAAYGSRTLVNNPWTIAGVNNQATTHGWHFDGDRNFTYTRGNNVWAREDITGRRDTLGVADESTTGTPSLTFDRVLDTGADPMASSNMGAGIDNLFYWNNVVHDITYQYGFDEAAGNFQSDNLNRGGAGKDYVHALAQDGGGTNNANFFTPEDGENPRMRMYLWDLLVTPSLQVNSPYAAQYVIAEGAVSSRNRLRYVGPVTAEVVRVDDLNNTHQACTNITNAAALVGKIALIERGGSNCSFVQKIKRAQDAGAVGVIVVNNVAGSPLIMSGDDTTIVIPAVMMMQADGNTIKANLPGVTATLSASGHYVDGALDNGVVVHEYTHGISNRLTAGPSNVTCLTNIEQMGEGWSDYVALMLTTNWATAGVGDGVNKRPIGNYALGQLSTEGGIRRFPYSTDMSINPLTYDSLPFTGGQEHSIGEIWCAALWDMTWNIIAMEGIDGDIYHGTKGNNIALQLVMQGMKYQPCGPGFLDGRDAILKADSLLYNNAHKCAIWNAFARRGMGKSASQGSAHYFNDQTYAKDLPTGLSIMQTVNKDSVANGDNLTFTIKATCDCTAQNNISIVDTLSSNLSFVSAAGGTYTAPYVRFDGVNFAPGETKSFTIQTTANGSYAAPVALINDSRDPGSYTWMPSGSGFWTEVTTKSHSPTHAWYAANTANTTQRILTSGSLLLDTLSTLSFWHYYDTEAAFDGGVVEISTNGGSSWQDLGAYMTQNGYNSNLPPFPGDPIPTTRRGFSGSSDQFIQTIVPLTGFAGKTAQLRFRFVSDNTMGADGWYIDDILLKNQKGVTGVVNVFSGATLLSGARTVASFAAATLPVNFLTFDAKRHGDGALLRWKVNGEINVSHYVVERSNDGNTFMAIGSVPASPITAYEKEYVFTDQQPLAGNVYYRIAEKDPDGSTTYSLIRLVTFPLNGLLVKVSPVPTYDHRVRLDIATGDNAVVTATLVNPPGQVLKAFRVRQGVNWLSLDNFSKGVYFLKIQTSNNEYAIRKIVIE